MNIGTKVTLNRTLSDGTKLHGKILGVELIQDGYYLSAFSPSQFFKTFTGKCYKVGYENTYVNKMFTEWFNENEISKYRVNQTLYLPKK